SGEQRRTDAILDAAFEVFSVRGYHNSTVDDIAQQAGVSKGTCYQYFSGKEEIFLATMDRTMDKLFAEAEAAAAGQNNALARMGFKGMTFVSRFKELQFLFFGLYTEVLGGNEKLRVKASELFDKVASFIAKDIDLGMEQKIFRKLNPMNIGYAMLGIAQAVGNLSLTNDDFDPVDFFVSLMEFMQHGLMAETKEE
ncbi:MAG TPA: TetR/AcrR family transcriptional regulator, partial [Candidatus Anoxymicrobiaceae bacterium]